MTNDRAGSVAIIIGAVGGMVTMGLHPSARTPELELLSGGAHAIAIASLPLLFFGVMTLTRRLRPDVLPKFALTAFAMGAIGAMIATTLDGFIAPRLVIDTANVASRTGEATRALVVFTFRLIDVFTRIYVVSASVAIGVWSASMLRRRLNRAAGFYGLGAGVIAALAVGVARIRLEVHVMLAVVLLHAVWFIMVGVTLWRVPERSPENGDRGCAESS
jgi:hypothetical protein